jgi:hypothetical protein
MTDALKKAGGSVKKGWVCPHCDQAARLTLEDSGSEKITVRQAQIEMAVEISLKWANCPSCHQYSLDPALELLVPLMGRVVIGFQELEINRRPADILQRACVDAVDKAGIPLARLGTVGCVKFERQGDEWWAGGRALGQRRRLRWDSWRVLFWVGRHDAPEVRAELVGAGVVGKA